jgi:hypothetical protein
MIELRENELNAWRLYAAASLTGWRAYPGPLADDPLGLAARDADAMVEAERERTADLQEFLSAKANGATATSVEQYRSACRQLEEACKRENPNMESLARLERLVGA